MRNIVSQVPSAKVRETKQGGISSSLCAEFSTSPFQTFAVGPLIELID